MLVVLLLDVLVIHLFSFTYFVSTSYLSVHLVLANETVQEKKVHKIRPAKHCSRKENRENGSQKEFIKLCEESRSYEGGHAHYISVCCYNEMNAQSLLSHFYVTSVVHWLTRLASNPRSLVRIPVRAVGIKPT